MVIKRRVGQNFLISETLEFNFVIVIYIRNHVYKYVK